MAQLMSIKKNVNVQPGVGVPEIFHCSQGDKGTRIILGLLNNNDNYTIPEGTTAIIRGSRADGTLFTEITADIDTTTEIKFNLTEDMTSVAGPVECEAVMSSGSANVIGTANFIINVEKSPASVGSVFPGTDAATAWLIDKLENEPINALNDESVVDAINDSTGSGLTEDIKQALLTLAEKVAYIDEDGQDYYDALYDALYPPAPPATLTSITCVYTQSGVVYDTDTLDSLKSDLVVTAHYDNSTSQVVTTYTLSGTLTAGTSTITVSYGGKTTTFNVVVTAAPTLTSISAVYTQSGTVYDTDSLDSLKSDLVVTAHMSDSTTQTVTNYTLSGTLTVGTSTITVTYSGKTTTFNVTVTEKQTIHITYTQGSIGSGNTDANRVSGVITDLLHFGEESYRLSVADGYSVYPFGFNANGNESTAGTRSGANILYTYAVSDSGYVPTRNSDVSGTLSADSISLASKNDYGWKTDDIIYSFVKTGSYDYSFKGLGFLVKKNDESSILPEEIASLVTFELVEA